MGDEPLNAYLSQASFWAPDYLVESAWSGHAPFAFWICGVCRPRRFVELGTHSGFSYFAFCQAVKLLELEAECFAVDTWRGDEHSGFYGEDVLRLVKEQNDAKYSGFSTLIRGTFDEALERFEDGSVDLLHIDGRHFYEDVRHDFESWRRKLSDGAVVLFHDTNVRQRGFGVFRFWAEISKEHQSFEFFHSHGLGVLVHGRNRHKGIVKFFAAVQQPSVAFQVRTTYGVLGSRIEAEILLQQQQERIEELDQNVNEVAQKLSRMTSLKSQEERRSKRIQSQIDSILQSSSWRLTKPLRRLSALLRKRSATCNPKSEHMDTWK